MRRAAPMLLLLLACACARKSDQLEPCREDKAARPVDPTLLAFLSRARAAHHLADQAEANHDLGAALEALRKVTDGPRLPGDAAAAPEVKEVLADTLAREADLESQRGEHDVASRLVEEGLGLVPTATYFRGHLFEVRGIAEERRAARLAAEGSAAEAAKAKARALEALEEAMRIQAEVISGQRDDKH